MSVSWLYAALLAATLITSSLAEDLRNHTFTKRSAGYGDNDHYDSYDDYDEHYDDDGYGHGLYYYGHVGRPSNYEMPTYSFKYFPSYGGHGNCWYPSLQHNYQVYPTHVSSYEPMWRDYGRHLYSNHRDVGYGSAQHDRWHGSESGGYGYSGRSRRDAESKKSGMSEEGHSKTYGSKRSRSRIAKVFYPVYLQAHRPSYYGHSMYRRPSYQWQSYGQDRYNGQRYQQSYRMGQNNNQGYGSQRYQHSYNNQGYGSQQYQHSYNQGQYNNRGYGGQGYQGSHSQGQYNNRGYSGQGYQDSRGQYSNQGYGGHGYQDSYGQGQYNSQGYGGQGYQDSYGQGQYNNQGYGGQGHQDSYSQGQYNNQGYGGQGHQDSYSQGQYNNQGYGGQRHQHSYNQGQSGYGGTRDAKMPTYSSAVQSSSYNQGKAYEEPSASRAEHTAY